jgi:hypothetical protein
MKRIVVSLLVPLLAAGFLGNANAAPHKGRAAAAVARPATLPAPQLAANGYSGYYERVLGKVPFGSQLWWRVYESQPRGR